MNGNIMVETRHKVFDTGIVTVSNTMGLHKKGNSDVILFAVLIATMLAVYTVAAV